MNEKTKKKTLTYLLAFTIPLVIRAIPELKYKYPLGADTPFYMYTIKYGKIPPLIMSIWRQNNIYYTLLTHIGKTGIDPMFFFKIYPPIVFTLTILAFVAYADIKLKWKPRDLIILSTTMTLTPALLRLSWDLHRQNFATLILAWTIVLYSTNLSWKIKAPTILASLITIGLTHEMPFIIALTIFTWTLIETAIRNKQARKKLIPTTLLALTIPLIIYLHARNYQIEYMLNKTILDNKWALTWKSLDHFATIALLSFGFQIPFAIAGAFYNPILTSWLIPTMTPYLTLMLAPKYIGLYDRWLYLAAPTIAFYAANYIRKLDFRKIAPYAILLALTIQPLSMIGTLPLPLIFYAGKTLNVFTDLLAPCISEERIEALQYFKQYIEKQSKIKTIGFHPWYLSGWISYIYGNYNLKYYGTTLAWARKGKTLYYITFNDHRNPMLKYKNINQTKIATYKELALYILNPK